MGNMKVHQFARALWEHEPSLTLGCKRLRPLAPKLPNTNTTTTTTTDTTPNNSSLAPNFDLKSFIRPESGPIKLVSSLHDNKKDPPNSPHVHAHAHAQQVETHPGGTRWNPTQEQIGILEMLYRGGMRTPNAQQIEHITAQLGKYGKIEGKNVFYWFQNHKARERQKQKRNNHLPHTPHHHIHTHTHTHTHTTPPTPTPTPTINHTIPLGQRTTRGRGVERNDEEDSPYKKKCRTISWGFECLELEEQSNRSMSSSSSSSCKDQTQMEERHRTITLELFPLHPEGR